jgi:hypothetical protein
VVSLRLATTIWATGITPKTLIRNDFPTSGRIEACTSKAAQAICIFIKEAYYFAKLIQAYGRPCEQV